jgi:hypothetical protein
MRRMSRRSDVSLAKTSDAVMSRCRVETIAPLLHHVLDDEGDVVLALVSEGSYWSDTCRAEQLRSLRKGKCVIPILVQRNSDIPLYAA